MLIAILLILTLAALGFAVLRALRGDGAGTLTGALVGAILVVLLVFTLTACGDTNVYVGGSTQIQQTPSGGQLTPGPGVGSSKGPVSKVEIKGVVGGEHCSDGRTPAAASRSVGVGCYLDITVNPLDPAGAVIFDTTVAGNAPEVFRELGESSAATFRQDGGNGYNGRITGLAPGQIVLEAQVKGVKSDPTTFVVK